MDTVQGAQNGHTPCLLTLTGRKTRTEIIRKLPDGTAASVAAALDALEREPGTRFQLYVVHPALRKRSGRAHERGNNEHGNGIIRRFFPKGTDFSLVTEEQAAGVQAWMNRYPRKILKGLSPEQLLPFRLLA